MLIETEDLDDNDTLERLLEDCEDTERLDAELAVLDDELVFELDWLDVDQAASVDSDERLDVERMARVLDDDELEVTRLTVRLDSEDEDCEEIVDSEDSEDEVEIVEAVDIVEREDCDSDERLERLWVLREE